MTSNNAINEEDYVNFDENEEVVNPQNGNLKYVYEFQFPFSRLTITYKRMLNS